MSADSDTLSIPICQLACHLLSCGPDAACMPVDREFPGEIEKIRTWFQDYKIPDGKPANVFGYDNKV